MFNGLTALLLCLVALPASDERDTQDSDRELLNQIAANLNQQIADDELERRDLTITVKDGQVTVTGRIEEAKESSQILESIVNVNGVLGLQLNLGIGRQPSTNWPLPYVQDVNSKHFQRPLIWDDGEWQLDFGKQPIE